MELLKFDVADADEITTLFTDVFSNSEGEAEGKVIGCFVEALISTTLKKDLFGFVAKIEGVAVGAIFFSRLMLQRDGIDTDKTAFILSPVAVASSHQGQGLGQTLISHGIQTLKSSGVDFVFTYGDPNYYSKVGFIPITEGQVSAPLTLTYPEGWLAQPLGNLTIADAGRECRCVPALNDPNLW